jgi:hypothetical protein
MRLRVIVHRKDYEDLRQYGQEETKRKRRRWERMGQEQSKGVVLYGYPD